MSRGSGSLGDAAEQAHGCAMRAGAVAHALRRCIYFVAALCCCSFCRYAAPSAALRVSACGLKLEGARASTPACAKTAHAGDPGPAAARN
jgi:hypothetical protein